MGDHQNYLTMADKLTVETKAFIHGEFSESKGNKTFETFNPATGMKIADVTLCGEDELNEAVNSARAVFERGDWSKLHPVDRKNVLLAWADKIEENQQELAVLESIDSGKPIRDCLEGDIPETVECLRWYAGAIDKVFGDISPSGENVLGMVIKEPIGVVGAVLPWNFPLLMMAWKIAPALASGNSVIVKPAEQTSLSALYIAKLASESDLPPGVFNVLPGYGEVLGKAIGLHQDIDIVSFTGSTDVGRLFLKYSAESNLKKITLECGGKSPSVVLSGAKDLDRISEQVANAVFWNMGENCTSNSRLIVHKKHKDELVNNIVEKTKALKMGCPLNPENDLGAINSTEHFDKVVSYIEQGKANGAKLIQGGKYQSDKGLFIEPTIFDEVSPDMTIAKEEIFGPVLSILVADSDDEALRIANDTCYGLQASLYTQDVSEALRVSKQLKAGSVSVNCYAEGDITVPFGGYKLSGFGGRDKGLAAFDQYTETKTIWIDLEH